MSNGHLPDGTVVATLAMLREANTTMVLAKNASARVGYPIAVRIRVIRKSRYFAMLPPRPPESEAWPTEPEEYAKHYDQWRSSLSEVDAAARRMLEEGILGKVLEAGIVDPPYSGELVDLLADDADDIALEITRFSGILTAKETTQEPVSEGHPAPVAN